MNKRGRVPHWESGERVVVGGRGLLDDGVRRVGGERGALVGGEALVGVGGGAADAARQRRRDHAQVLVEVALHVRHVAHAQKRRAERARLCALRRPHPCGRPSLAAQLVDGEGEVVANRSPEHFHADQEVLDGRRSLLCSLT
jgi:hypothetical protein